MLLTHQFNSFKSGVIQQFFLRNDIFHCALLSLFGFELAQYLRGRLDCPINIFGVVRNGDK